MQISSKFLISLLILSFLSPQPSHSDYERLQDLIVSYAPTALAFTDDADYLAIGGQTGVLEIYQIQNETFSNHSVLTNDSSLGQYLWTKFSSDGIWLVACTNVGTIKVFKKNQLTSDYEENQEITATS